MNKRIIVAIMLVALLATSFGTYLLMDNGTDNPDNSNNLDGYQPLPKHKFDVVNADLKEILPDNEYVEFITTVDDSIIFVANEKMFITDNLAQEEPKEVFELINFEYMISAGKNHAVYESLEHELVVKWKDKTYVLEAFEIEHGMMSMEVDEDNNIVYYVKLEGNNFNIMALDLESGKEDIIVTTNRNTVIMDFRVDIEGKNLAYITYAFPEGTDMEDEDIWYLDEYEDNAYWIDLSTKEQTKVEIDIANPENERLRIWDVYWLNPKDLLVGVVYTESLRHVSHIYNIDTEKYDVITYNDKDFWIYHNSTDGKELLGVEAVKTQNPDMEETYNLWYYNVDQDKYVQLTEYEEEDGFSQDRRPILNEDSKLVAFERWKGFVTGNLDRLDLMVSTIEGETKTLVEGFVALSIVGWVAEDKMLIIGAKEKPEDIKFYIVTIR